MLKVSLHYVDSRPWEAHLGSFWLLFIFSLTSSPLDHSAIAIPLGLETLYIPFSSKAPLYWVSNAAKVSYHLLCYSNHVMPRHHAIWHRE